MRGILGMAIALLLAAGAEAQTDRQPVSEVRIDAAGVEWAYEEFLDDMTDTWNALLFATMTRGVSRGAAIGVVCFGSGGWSPRIELPRSSTVMERQYHFQIRVDRDPALDATVERILSDSPLFHIMAPVAAGWRLREALQSAQERVVLRDQEGNTYIIPMSEDRPEAARLEAACRVRRRPPQ